MFRFQLFEIYVNFILQSSTKPVHYYNNKTTKVVLNVVKCSICSFNNRRQQHFSLHSIHIGIICREGLHTACMYICFCYRQQTKSHFCKIFFFNEKDCVARFLVEFAVGFSVLNEVNNAGCDGVATYSARRPHFQRTAAYFFA